MKNIIFTFCTKNLEPFKINFYSTLKGDYHVIHEYIDLLINNETGGGMQIWEYKISKIIELINKNINKDIKIFVFDLDIQFFDDISSCVDMLFNKHNLDIAFQAETIFHGANIGVCVIKPNEKSKFFWNNVYNHLKSTGKWDQKIVNEYIWRNGIENYKEIDIKIGILPKEIYACSTSKISQNIILHHANCTSDFNEKWNQFEFTRRVLDKKFEFQTEFYTKFLNSSVILFSPLDSQKFEPSKVMIQGECIDIEKYGKFNIIFDNNFILLKSKSNFAKFEHLIFDDFFNKILIMGYFCNLGKIRGIYNRCYFIASKH